MSTLAGRIEGDVHRLDIRVYYEDTDFSGAVYHANYLKFCERGRSDFLRLLGVHHHELLAQDGSGFVVRRITCEFLKPARIDDVLTVVTRITKAAGARFDLAQRILRGGDTMVEAEVMAALVDRHGKPRRLPGTLAATLARLAAGDAVP